MHEHTLCTRVRNALGRSVRVRTSGCTSLAEAIVAVDFGYKRTSEPVARLNAQVARFLTRGRLQASTLTCFLLPFC